MYQGYKLIGRDMDVRGGVFHTKRSGSEAILVDQNENPGIYLDYLEDVCERAEGKSGKVLSSRVVPAVFSTVRARMPATKASEEEVALLCQERGIARGQVVGLSMFMEEGIGVCRHSALVAATLLEDFKEANIIDGQISVDRNLRWNPEDKRVKKNGHAWVRFTTPEGIEWVLDPALGVFCPVHSVVKVDRWKYYDEEAESRPMVQEELGRTGVKGFLRAVFWEDIMGRDLDERDGLRS
jgi:hypothetical protein